MIDQIKTKVSNNIRINDEEALYLYRDLDLLTLGKLAQEKRQAAKKRAMAMQGATPLASNKMPEMERMFAGGSMKRTRSIDGCAKKGKTRAV